MNSSKKKATSAEEPNSKNSERAWEDNYGNRLRNNSTC